MNETNTKAEEPKKADKPAAKEGKEKKIKRALSDEQKDALKKLRVLKSDTQAALLKEHMSSARKVKKAVQKALADGPATIPELAKKVDAPADRILWTMTGLRKYGVVDADGVDGDYPRYKLAEKL